MSAPRGSVPQRAALAVALLVTVTVAAGRADAASAAAQDRPAVVRDTAVLTVRNRPITVFRAPLGAASPTDRAVAALRRVEQIMERDLDGRVEMRRDPAGVLVGIGGAWVFAITVADIDSLAGETVEQAALAAAERLREALEVDRESRSVPQLLRAAAFAALATVVFMLVLRMLVAVQRAAMRWLPAAARANTRSVAIAGFTLLRSDQIVATARRVLGLAAWAVGLFLAYLWLTFVLTRFAYSRPWGEALGSYLRETIQTLLVGVLHGVPGLFTVVLIFVGTRWIARIVRGFFEAVEARTVQAPWVHPDTANPTRRIVVALLWLFALVVAYPYLPGSGSDVFKGISVFAGVVLSIGSSGVMNQAMSGLVLMYSRALRPGDYVRVGETEGVVTELGMLSTKIRTTKHEQITIPNAVVVGATIKNYSRLAAEGDAVLLYATVTIGYDIPWRQVHAMLVTAAGRTAGLRADPAPFVHQTALSDFYVEYQLNTVLDEPATRMAVLSELHGHIIDVFNEHGVQIMSPHYESDPPRPLVVAPEHRHGFPAGEQRRMADTREPHTRGVKET